MTWRYVLLALAAFAFVVAALAFSGAVPAEALRVIVVESLGTPAGLRSTLREATPLLILGAAVFLALRAGLFNIGADGQFVIGALAAVAVALAIPTPVGAALAIVAGIAAGALWALPAGLIKAYRGGHEVITTIMLNNIAFFLTVAIVKGPLKDPGSQSPTTTFVDPAATLPNLVQNGPFRLNLALVFAVLAVLALWFYLKKTVSGYELAATGGNPTAAKFAGVAVQKVTVKAMLASGALAGLAGALQVLAYEKRFYAGFSPGYGFDALGVALLAGTSAPALLGSGLLFGVLAKGTTALGLTGVPKGISGVLLGVLILVFAAFAFRKVVNRNA